MPIETNDNNSKTQPSQVFLVEPNEIRYSLKSNEPKSNDRQTPTAQSNQPVYVTTGILELNHSLLEEMAQYLLHHEVLEGQPLKEYLQQAQVPDELNDWLNKGKPWETTTN